MDNNDIVKKWDAYPKDAELEPIIESAALEGQCLNLIKEYIEKGLADHERFLAVEIVNHICAGIINYLDGEPPEDDRTEAKIKGEYLSDAGKEQRKTDLKQQCGRDYELLYGGEINER